MVQTVTVNDAARIKGISRQAVHAAIKAGKLNVVIVEVPSKRITRQSLNKWQPNANMKRAGRKPMNDRPKRQLCEGCLCELTTTDKQAGYCTNCKVRL